MEKLFETATRTKLRFATTRGMVTTEDLWDMRLTKADNFDLDHVAQTLAKEIRETGEDSFVKPVTRGTDDNELKLEIVKHLIAIKLADKEKHANAAAKKEKKDKLLGILAKKQDEALEGKTEDEILAELAALDG